ncbi:FAD-dependent oxidoreductase [Eubacterium oxidoreducens]|uniref:Succinate dehydrogenase/fumarate reductase, flavoprotein subunit n=1 Tax=Eubacterium oxidoreducens TaxID=1732 RepID=A0A1G6CJJ4_EUBOX|nr:FAD-binding protein [Eubacterium oxidoreducens]SDB32962.1 Succinate dehydrogenase/fumarate reductase, flavoprotein subunit [Eubacterium oxidoreducens]
MINKTQLNDYGNMTSRILGVIAGENTFCETGKRMDFQRNRGNEFYEWPYPVKYDKTTHVYTDVLVIGGGLAGASAGIRAAKRGVKVAVCDKAPIKKSGCGGAGMDHWNTVLECPGSPITTEENIERSKDTGLNHRNYIAEKGTWDALLELEKLGLNIRDDLDEFKGAATRDEESKLLKAYDYREMVSVKLHGGNYIKPVLYEGLIDYGAELYERIMVTSLLTNHGKQGADVVGATGFSLETGEFYVFHAKAVIISTGYACSMWIYNMEITGNSYRWDPNEIGEGLAMAWMAGADVYNMHKAGSTKGNTPFAWPRFGVGNPANTWFPCSMVDNNGKEIPWEDIQGNILKNVHDRNYPAKGQPYIGSKKSDNMPGIDQANLIHNLAEKIRDGEYELPFWADLAGMPEDERRSIWGVMIGNEGKSRFTLYDLYTRSGFDPEKDMLMAPIELPENYMKFGAWFHGEPDVVKPWRTENGGQGEIACDWKLMTNVPGLFVAGASGGLEGCSFAVSSGFYAADRAADYVKDANEGAVSEKQLAAEKQRVYAPVKRNGRKEAYISWKELWGGICRVMQQCCGEYKTIPILKQGLVWLDSIKNTEGQMTYARNPHELARVLECDTRFTVASIFLNACISKIENEEFMMSGDGYLFNRLDGDKILTIKKEKEYWLKGQNAPSYKENYLRYQKRSE